MTSYAGPRLVHFEVQCERSLNFRLAYIDRWTTIRLKCVAEVARTLSNLQSDRGWRAFRLAARAVTERRSH